ncbi:MAG: hypothetical protein KGL39_24150 [Patescibacteria group bacterium]|nr:hypothetical protein [Patescibacteria group bacterium]
MAFRSNDGSLAELDRRNRLMVWTAPDFGMPPTGQIVERVPDDGIEAITRRITVIRAPSQLVLRLPSPHGQPIEAWVLNESDFAAFVQPGNRDRLGALDPDEPLALAPGSAVIFWFLDTTIGAPPRTWRYVVIPGGPREHEANDAAA